MCWRLLLAKFLSFHLLTLLSPSAPVVPLVASTAANSLDVCPEWFRAGSLCSVQQWQCAALYRPQCRPKNNRRVQCFIGTVVSLVATTNKVPRIEKKTNCFLNRCWPHRRTDHLDDGPCVGIRQVVAKTTNSVSFWIEDPHRYLTSPLWTRRRVRLVFHTGSTSKHSRSCEERRSADRLDQKTSRNFCSAIDDTAISAF